MVTVSLCLCDDAEILVRTRFVQTTRDKYRRAEKPASILFAATILSEQDSRSCE